MLTKTHCLLCLVWVCWYYLIQPEIQSSSGPCNRPTRPSRACRSRRRPRPTHCRRRWYTGSGRRHSLRRSNKVEKKLRNVDCLMDTSAPRTNFPLSVTSFEQSVNALSAPWERSVLFVLKPRVIWMVSVQIYDYDRIGRRGIMNYMRCLKQ